jgi:predicted deacylase
MTQQVDVGPVRARRGTSSYGVIPIATAADGGDIGVGVHLVAGARPGPKVVVMTTSHGNEYLQIECLRALLDGLDPEALTGDLVLVPVQNPVAFEMGTRGSWIDGLWGDSGNLNRLWPGRANGWLTERITNTIVTAVYPGATVIMDLHGPTRDFHLSYGYVGMGGPGDVEYDLSLAYGQEMLVWNSPADLAEKGQTSTTSRTSARRAGLITYGGEQGEFFGLGLDRANHRADELYRGIPEIGVTGITNALKFLGMLDGDLVLPPTQVRVTPELNLRPAHGGLLVSHVGKQDLGTVIPGGTVLGTVISPYSFATLDEIVAPFEQSLLIAGYHQKPFSKVLPGEFVYIVADNARTEVLDRSHLADVGPRVA